MRNRGITSSIFKGSENTSTNTNTKVEKMWAMRTGP